MDARILIRAVCAAKELVAGSQTWLVEIEGPRALPAVNIDVWSKEKETSNERGTDNCGLGLNKARPKNSMSIQCLYFFFPHLPMFLVDLFVFKFPVHIQVLENSPVVWGFVLYDQWYTSVDIVLNILMHTYMYVVLIPT